VFGKRGFRRGGLGRIGRGRRRGGLLQRFIGGEPVSSEGIGVTMVKSVLGGMGIIGAVVLLFLFYMSVSNYGDIMRYLKAERM
jgi:hypothetical protein